MKNEISKWLALITINEIGQKVCRSIDDHFICYLITRLLLRIYDQHGAIHLII